MAHFLTVQSLLDNPSSSLRYFTYESQTRETHENIYNEFDAHRKKKLQIHNELLEASVLDAVAGALSIPSACLTVAMRSDTRSVIHGTCAWASTAWWAPQRFSFVFRFTLLAMVATDCLIVVGFIEQRRYQPACSRRPSDTFLHENLSARGSKLFYFNFCSFLSPFVAGNQNSIEVGRAQMSLTSWNMAYMYAQLRIPYYVGTVLI